MSPLTIRPETRSDHAQIGVVTEAAFAEVEHSNGSEAAIVEKLRADNDLALSLVAETGKTVVGHVAVSQVTISDGSEGWYGLGPISVLPAYQHQGVGLRLMQRAIALMRDADAKGIVVLGEPAYYARFGFEHDPRLCFPGPPAEYFQRILLGGDAPSGKVSYAPAFG